MLDSATMHPIAPSFLSLAHIALRLSLVSPTHSPTRPCLLCFTSVRFIYQPPGRP
jgi:hypothetical protein